MNRNDAQRSAQDALRRFWPSKLHLRLIAIALLCGISIALATVLIVNEGAYMRIYGARCPTPNADPKLCMPTEFWFFGRGWPSAFVLFPVNPDFTGIPGTIAALRSGDARSFNWQALLFDVAVFSIVVYGTLLVANRFRPRAA